MAEFPLNIPTDDALTLLESEGPHPATLHDPSDAPDESDDDDETEDPVTRGQSRAGRKDMFVPSPPPRHPRRIRGGHQAGPRPGGFLSTPGASRIP